MTTKKMDIFIHLKMNNLKEYIIEKLKIDRNTKGNIVLSDKVKEFFDIIGVDRPENLDRIELFNKLLNEWFKEKGNEDITPYIKNTSIYHLFNIQVRVQKYYKFKSSGIFNDLYYKLLGNIITENPLPANEKYLMFISDYKDYKYLLVSIPEHNKDSEDGESIISPNNTIIFK